MKRISFKRLAAFAIDYVLIALFIGLLLAINLLFFEVDSEPSARLVDKVVGHATALLTLTLPVWLYFTLMESLNRATVGKRLLKIQVVDLCGNQPTTKQTGIRNAIRLAPWEIAHSAIWYVPERPFIDPMPAFNLSVCIFANVLALYFSISLFVGNGRTLYDTISGTNVSPRLSDLQNSVE